MKYSTFIHIINTCLLIALFALPISECFINDRIPFDVGQRIINIASLMAIFLFLDFYKFNLSNKFNGIAIYLSLSVIVIAISLLLASVNGVQFSTHMLLGNNFQTWNAAWYDLEKTQTLYMLGLSLLLTSFAMITRLLLLNTVNKEPVKLSLLIDI